MQKYKVLKYFQWGKLKLEKGQKILIKDYDDSRSMVSIEHYPEKSQPVGKEAEETMIFLKKIEKY